MTSFLTISALYQYKKKFLWFTIGHSAPQTISYTVEVKDFGFSENILNIAQLRIEKVLDQLLQIQVITPIGTFTQPLLKIGDHRTFTSSKLGISISFLYHA